MLTTLLWILALGACLLAIAALPLSLVEAVPVTWQYWQARIRRPATRALLALGTVLAFGHAGFPYGLIECSGPLLVLLLSVFAAEHLHQSRIFVAVTDPALAYPDQLPPLGEDDEVALVEVGDERRAYPLAYVAHHHVVNDTIQGRTIAVTYCPMCRTIIVFDATDIGPLRVGSYRHGNLVLEDERTGTFFQQASFSSLVGPRHPHTLTPIGAQVLPWAAVRQLVPPPRVVAVTEHDLRPFELPIPGLWPEILASSIVPGLSRRGWDPTRPARARVIAFEWRGHPYAIEKTALSNGEIRFVEGVALVVVGDTVSAFERTLGEHALDLRRQDDLLVDENTSTRWDLTGRRQEGPLPDDLVSINTYDQYWFSWSFFHPTGIVVDGAEASESPTTPS